MDSVTLRASPSSKRLLGHRLRHAVAHRPGREDVGAGQQHGELVVLEARDDVVLAQALLEAPGDLLEHLVAHRDAVLLVDGAHAVDVERRTA